MYSSNLIKALPRELPGWGEIPSKPGLYLSLSHGRDFPQQVMKGRGFPGPKIGPLLYVVVRYQQQVSLRFTTRRHAQRFFPDSSTPFATLQILEETLVFEDKCFGDWDVCYIDKEFCLPR